ncbi:twin-arginine translocation signal domain-containing protein [Streptomyces seoulensis]
MKGEKTITRRDALVRAAAGPAGAATAARYCEWLATTS